MFMLSVIPFVIAAVSTHSFISHYFYNLEIKDKICNVLQNKSFLFRFGKLEATFMSEARKKKSIRKDFKSNEINQRRHF